MPVSEEIFSKQIQEVIKKPKRKLSEKQKANLALGREKMRLKRELLKKEKETKKEIVKGDTEHIKIKKENIKKKRKTLKEINKEKEQNILNKLQKIEIQKNTRDDLYYTLKVKCLEKATSVKEYNQIKEALDGIDESTLHDDELLKIYAKKVMTPYMSVIPEEDIKEI
tara:strand:- start:79 stop:582 length:504 start_codon:yes stop_codon:yes gene_type:complete